jgi:magnesium transporter
MASSLESLAERFAADHPDEAALALAELPPAAAAAYLERVEPPLAADVASHMTARELVACVRCLPPQRAAVVLREMPRDAVASILRRLAAGEREGLLELLPESTSRVVRRLLRYPEGTAGSLVDPVALTVPARLTAGEALESVRRDPKQLRDFVYVVDEREHLLGVTDLRGLMSADPGAPLETLMVTDVHRIAARSDHQAILEHPGWDDVHTLPVVDERGVLVGVIRHETVRRLARRSRRRAPAGTPVAALAELYWSGTQRTVGELVSIATRRTS